MERILFFIFLGVSEKPKWEAVSTFEFCLLLGGLHRNYKVPFKEDRQTLCRFDIMLVADRINSITSEYHG